MQQQDKRRMAPWIWIVLALLALMIVAVAAVIARGGDNPTVSCSSDSALVCTKSIQVDGAARTVLATHAGKTLYAYKPDTSTSIVCTGACALAWPPLTVSGDIPSALTGLSGTLGVLSGGNGKQVLYSGHPLYSYALDVGTGDARGQGMEDGNWSVVTSDVAPLGAPSTAPTPTSPPYSGY